MATNYRSLIRSDTTHAAARDAVLPSEWAAVIAALSPVVYQALPGLQIEWQLTVDSTSTQLLERVRAGETRPICLIADTQTQGRGRLGRVWQAMPGDSLTFSCLLPWSGPDAPQSTHAAPSAALSALTGLSLALGVALAEALAPQVQVKWPNDLWLDQRKLGGILTEVIPWPQAKNGRAIIVGIGLNLATQALTFTETTSLPRQVAAAGLRELYPHIHAAQAWARLMPALSQAWMLFQKQGWRAFMPRFAAHDALYDQMVELWQNDRLMASGYVHGIDEQGGLVVHTAHGVQTWCSGEVSVRLVKST